MTAATDPTEHTTGLRPARDDLTTITDDEIFLSHVGGKLSVELTAPLETKRDLSIAYTPGWPR